MEGLRHAVDFAWLVDGGWLHAITEWHGLFAVRSASNSSRRASNLPRISQPRKHVGRALHGLWSGLAAAVANANRTCPLRLPKNVSRFCECMPPPLCHPVAHDPLFHTCTVVRPHFTAARRPPHERGQCATNEYKLPVSSAPDEPPPLVFSGLPRRRQSCCSFVTDSSESRITLRLTAAAGHRCATCLEREPGIGHRESSGSNRVPAARQR
mmetsp:Transcript_37340/g.110260  ORF Transcript_37340/g.110260 Transcript_37340/m.110260 type:complete len:211 (+) Transcript_37340:121-753(+)